MTFEEKVAMANTMRSRSRVGPVSPEELAVLPGTEKELWIEVADGRKVHLFEERPDALPENAALLLNFHGGGFIKGRTDRDRRYCCTLMEQLNCLVWDVDYCLAPEQAFPAAVEETYGIIAYASEHAPELGIDPQKILLAGHSPVETLLPPRLSKMRRSIDCIPAAHCSNISLWTTRSIRSTGSPRSCGPIRSGSSVPRRKSCTPTFMSGMPTPPIRCVPRSRRTRLRWPLSRTA